MALKNHLPSVLDDCNANGFQGRDWKAALSGLWFSPAIRILLSHRIQKNLKSKGGAWRVALARILWARSLSRWGCDIGNQADIAPGVAIPHTVGIVIGNFSKIEAGCTIFHGVTIGESHGRTPGRPVIRNGATIYANASVLGSVEIGKGATIGAHALVMQDVPAGAVFTVDGLQKKKKEKHAA